MKKISILVLGFSVLMAVLQVAAETPALENCRNLVQLYTVLGLR